MIHCIIGRNGVCNNDFSSGCYKCRMALCYDDSRGGDGIAGMCLQGNGTDLCFAKGVRFPGSFFETARFIFFGYPFVVTARTGMQAEGGLHRKQLYLLDRQLFVFSMGEKTGDMAGAKTVAVFPSHSEFYQKTLCSNWKRRFQTLQELQEYLLQMPS